ncbi:MAG: hypothetical protein MI725_05990, partial [Pirellulales bacterium]|nr:hypothetical protein [Pirellulales bacterium]
DPWIRLLVFSPAGPLLVDIAVKIDEQPFRAAREQWIDRLLSEAQNTRSVREVAALAKTIKAVAQSARNSQTDEDPEEEEQKAEEDADPPLVKAKGRKQRTMFARLVNYLAAEHGTADRQKVRWLLAELTGGPTVLALGPSFSWRRAEIAPLWHVLDEDHDGELSSVEVNQATSRLEQADVDEDDTIDREELTRFAQQYTPTFHATAYPLVMVLDGDTDWSSLRKHLLAAYGEKVNDFVGGQRNLTAELPKLLVHPADIVCRVTFGDDEGKLALLRAQGDVSPGEKAITIDLSGAYVEFSAVRDLADTANDMQRTQIAVGAVVDGNPLLRLLDTDGNQKLTQRERRKLADHLQRLDRNRDGSIGRAEIPTAIRLAVSQGPHVHKPLALPVVASAKRNTRTATAAPRWFLGMDRNQDGDLSRREFKGNPAQFAKLDRDGDDLISAEEAQESAPAGE